MRTLISVLAWLGLLVSQLLLRPEAAAMQVKSLSSERVIILLTGAAAASNPRFQNRSSFTHSRRRFDASLPKARQYVRALSRYQEREIGFLRHIGFGIRVRWRFHALLNGFGALIPTAQLAALRRAPNILAVIPERRYMRSLDRSAQLVNAPRAWAELGGSSEAGRGTYIANIDSGIDISHPCFRGTSFARPPYGLRTDSPGNRRFLNNKVVVARAFGDDPRKTYSAGDSQGHGTFTAAIAACDANTQTPLGVRISGIAPGAYLLNYNVFPAGSSGAYDDQIIAAVDAALLDAADVANLSLGSPQGTGDPRLDPEVAAIQSAEKAGLTVVVAAGNAGPTPQSIASPGDAPDAITVGAVSNSRGVYSSISVSGPGTVPPTLQTIRAREGSFPWEGTRGPARIVDVGLGRRPKNDPRFPMADDFSGKNLRGRIALMERGNGRSPSLLMVRTKVANAAAAGAVGAVIYDNHNEVSLPALDQGTTRLPVSFIGQQEGHEILDWRRTHARATLIMRSALSGYEEPPGLVAPFTSIGYTSGYGVKPDLVAPGQDIYAATQRSARGGDMYDPSGFTSQSGTSFAAPHVAGVVALVRQRHPSWTASSVKAVVVDTASTQPVPSQNGGIASVLRVGAGLLNAAAAISAPVYISPTQATLGQANTASGPVQKVIHLSLHDTGTGAGPWRLAVASLHGSPLLKVAVPGTVNLGVNGQVAIELRAQIAPEVPTGDYDGYVEASSSAGSVHIPYFLHVVNKSVVKASVLLVDATSSRFHPDSATVPHSDPRVASYYVGALRALHVGFTYWDEAAWGSPSLNDLRSAASAVYFTGANLNGYASANSDPEALSPPLGPVDLEVLHSYLSQGGRALLSGIGVALADPYWLPVVMGATRTIPSVFDNQTRDPQRKGGMSPTFPSAVSDGAPGIFSGLGKIDLSAHGDGFHDNAGIYNPVAGFIGVAGLKAAQGIFGANLHAYGHPALKSLGTQTAVDIATASSDEPTLSHSTQYRGRSVLLGFGFEGINNTAGYATRVHVLGRILQWYADNPRASVGVLHASAGKPLRLTADFASNVRTHPATFAWQVDERKYPSSSRPRTVILFRRGPHRFRVQIVDSIGHASVSSWKTVRVR